MSFDENTYLKLIKDTLDTVASGDNSVVKEAQVELKSYLETNTSITDNEKAQVYANFLTQAVTNAIQFSIQSATQISLENKEIEQKIASMKVQDDINKAQSDKDLDVKDTQITLNKTQNSKINEEINLIKKQEDEVTQKIASMKVQDDINKSQSDKDLDVKSAQIDLSKAQTSKLGEEINLIKKQEDEVTQKITSMQNQDDINKAQSDKDLDVKSAQIDEINQKIASMKAHDQAENNRVAGELTKIKYEVEHLMPAQTDNMAADTSLKNATIKLQDKEAELKEAQIEISQKEISLKDSEIKVQQANAKIAQEEIQLKQAQIPLVQAQTQTENAKSNLINAQVDTEKENVEALRENIAKTKIEANLLQAQIGLTNSEQNLKTQQAVAVLKALDVNKEIEQCKCSTELKIAALQVSKL